MEMELGKLFIGGISWDTNEDRLKKYFRDRATGRARGFGFVVFADPAVAERVVMEKHLIDGRNVEAKKAVPRDDQNTLNKNSSSVNGSPGPARTKKIFVGGLASTVTESDFKKYFDQFGVITDVVVMYDHNTQRPRGFGFITYDSEEAVDKVLHKTFHELNGKMVEVKRAVPKELSPGPTRNQVSSFLNGYTKGYNPSSVGGYGVRMDGRFSPLSAGRGTFLHLVQVLNPSNAGNSNIGSNAGYGRVSPYSGNASRYSNPIGFSGGNGGNSSVLNPIAHSLWGNESFNHASNNTNFTLWGSSANSEQGVVRSVNRSSNLSFGGGDFDIGLGGVGYGRNSRTGVAPVSSHAASNGGYDGAYADFYEKGSLYGDTTWQSSPSELDVSGSFGFGLGNATSDVMAKNSASYVGGYSVANRQSNRGIAA
ncbi:heterogeneous nuclear ribonucleoprotein [Salix suchowensis]|nr:heterogeneous nuclear ribonucleoprotein [Salix suchowensis]